ncbi:MAG: phosphatase PAP2 family protein [Bacteroidetes bacterium]|nr:phosphatase PAP2 family protein [Bacteroidota bacterium]
MTESFFRALSYIFHPLLMPVLGLYFLMELPTIPDSLYLYDALYFFPDEAKFRLYLVLGVLTFAAPLLSLLIMYWNGMITSLHLEKRKERFYPYFIVTFYYLLAYVFVRYQWPEELQHPALLGFLFGMVVVNLVSMLFNTKIKISAHATATFGVAALLIAYNQSQLSRFEELELPNLAIILFFILVSGLVVSARLFLKAHSLQEVLLGMFIGFTGIYLCVKFGLYY